ncbi:phospholipase D family protein [Parahaliea maris]|uniref:Phospholipase D family protein n=1 Tax=Parahaliea maris TaxID=2716870 RepID=A0A5C9A772_9GAMM|nr:phospholipase D family protein [Parahaliea maris]TXS95427.1 phospholipase D family protein [Parahaliea maris]
MKSSHGRGRLLLGLLLIGLLGACTQATIEVEGERPPASFALEPASTGLLAEIAEGITAGHGEEASGFRILDSSHSGLYWRLALIDSATTSLEIQTYLWYPDASGRLLLERVVAAARRGVRVRLILDDLLLQGQDQLIANLQAQDNIEFRIFNPWSQRDSLLDRAGEMIAELERLNTRMHDKLLIADGRAAVIGGRNVGDHYFGLNEIYNFHDTDLLGIGHIGVQANAMFDKFWNSDWVVSAGNLSTAPDPEVAYEQWQDLVARNVTSPVLEAFPRRVKDWSGELRREAKDLRIGRSKLVYDETATEQISQNVLSQIFNFFSLAQRELLIMNAYVIPSEKVITFMQELTDRGVKTRLLTNSLASHDVPAVNSHYEPWRDDFLEAGIDLYELRSDPAIAATVVDVAPVQAEFTGLHSKTAVVDRRYVFIGSMNFDPRSARINTEMGAFVDSPALAEDMAAIIERDMAPENAWRVQLDAEGELYWQNSEETVTRQPARNGMQRVMNLLMKLGPEDQY